MPSEFEEVEAKWARKWAEARVYERDPKPGTPKFFATYPYSYMNGFAHLGHGFTMIRNDVLTRYMRMKGYNALFPMGWHVTGTPIVAAANRIRDGEPKQAAILRDMGIPAEEVPKFADPKHWVAFFPPEWRKDADRLGLGIDWRREFFTTDMNPHYDAFIRWQFYRLKEKGYVAKGKHPIMWCPKDNAPVADHDRTEGEGETPQEWTLYKMPVQGAVPGVEGSVSLIAATLRPDTVFGQTNVWVDPAVTYRLMDVSGERWVVNAGAAQTLLLQLEGARELPTQIPGTALLGLRVKAPGTGAVIPVLPASFIREGKGTGIVTSVPSDSPQDLLSLQAMQVGAGFEVLHAQIGDSAFANLVTLAQGITPIPVIRTQKYGTESAAKAVAEVGATSHTQADKIAAATDLAYNAGFYEGVMLENAQQFAGKPTAEVKEGIREWLLGRGEAATGYWPSGPVRCRCLTPCVVKIVSDQWFMKYSDAEWKQKAHEAMDRMQFMPELARKQFHYVVDWLREWACARETGLGTKLPWDERWLIESLSDSTIYMAYYHLAPWLEPGTVTGGGSKGRKGPGVDAKDLTEAFFDYVLLGKGSPEAAAKGTVTADLVRKCREEFEYWYPVDFRNSGKDLLQNHLTFFVFNHVAIWDDPKYWPKAIGVNGWLLLNGEKMSKSSGNFMTLRQGLDRFGVTGTRLALANAGEGVDDANFEEDFAHNATKRVRQFLEYARAPPAARAEGDATVDAWFRSVMYGLVNRAGAEMEAGNFRTAFKLGFFDLQREWAWYMRRSGGTPTTALLKEFLSVQNRIITPFAPHVAEEVHEVLGLPGFAIDAQWPTAPAGALSPAAEAAEAFVRRVLDDTREILKVTGIQPKRIVYYTSPAWKRTMMEKALQLAAEGNLKVPTLMNAAMQDPEIKKNGKDAPKLAQDLVKELGSLKPEDVKARASGFDETAALKAAAPFLSGEFGGPRSGSEGEADGGVGRVEVAVFAAGEPGVEDPAGKARFAAPGRPAIYVV
ncbi:MAG TPA: leucine--tRNA ligase [Candidatus Thermoplasmatota archaeon]|nr:leucine--tRNA ligase [Candidatus Thermoplasmatota archaeon]